MTPDDIKNRLARLAAAGQSASRSAAAIVEASGERRSAVDDRLQELAPQSIPDPMAGDEYQRLMAERGRLDIVSAGS